MWNVTLPKDLYFLSENAISEYGQKTPQSDLSLKKHITDAQSQEYQGKIYNTQTKFLAEKKEIEKTVTYWGLYIMGKSEAPFSDKTIQSHIAEINKLENQISTNNNPEYIKTLISECRRLKFELNELLTPSKVPSNYPNQYDLSPKKNETENPLRDQTKQIFLSQKTTTVSINTKAKKQAQENLARAHLIGWTATTVGIASIVGAVLYVKSKKN